MANQPISESDLLAYLHGEHQPHVEQALRESHELRRTFEQLRYTSTLFQRIAGQPERPSPEDMSAVALGRATAAQKLRVTAYLRACPDARADLDALRLKLRPDTPDGP